MLQYSLIFSIIIAIPILSSATNKLSEYSAQTTNIKNHLQKNQTYVQSQVNTLNKSKQQTFNITILGLHQKSCKQTFRYLSRYENYKEYLSFVKDSKYNETTKRVTFLLSSYILPFNMILDFKIPRITKAGSYPFIFDNGFLKNLEGKVIVEDISIPKKKFRCFVSVKASWKGPKTKIPNTIFELFTATIGRIGVEKLFKASGHHY